MNSKNVKVVDEHNIDRTANVMFAFDLEGSEYVSYWIARDEENNNLFVSKIIKNIDNTFNMLDIDDSDEKVKLDGIVKKLIQDSVDSQADKLASSTLTLSDGKVVKFIAVNFNKEQRINVHKTYITTVKKEVTRVAEKYYAVEVAVEQPQVVEDIFPSVTPVVEPVKETIVESPVVAPVTPVVETPVLSVPTVETPVVSPVAPVAEPAKVEVQPEIPVMAAVQPEPSVVEPITVATPTEPVVTQPVTPVAPVISPVVEPTPVAVQPEPQKVEPTVVAPTPVPAAVGVDNGTQPLVFNASKETNLNAALGEVANTSTIPVENIQPIREFGVDAPVPPVASQPQTVVPPVQENPTNNVGVTGNTGTQKAGFANSKFFMVVAVAFFLASCIFLGYEVFNYFQLTK